MKVVVPPVVRSDIRGILTETHKLFGPTQLDRYAGYVKVTLARLGQDPLWASSRDRSDILPGLRSIHLALASGRSSAAAHVVYYRVGVSPRGERLVFIVRILHERADPGRNLG